MRIYLFGLVVLSLPGCAIDSPASSESLQASEVTSHTTLTTSGRFVGTYVVPTSADLASAAIFSVPEVNWSISGGGTATLHYDLPVGLVGGSLSVQLGGPLGSGSTSVQVASANGTGTCTASGTVISCSESLTNLGTLPISMTVVQQTATTTFSGPVSSRVAVAEIFSSDPIGTVSFDVSQPSGGDGGGGGGGRGPH
jgi:hypothetical protein